jgi:HSP20 family protein
MAIKDLIPTNLIKKNVPVRRDEWSTPFYSLQREINRMFDDFFTDFKPARWFSESQNEFVPKIDLKETDDDIKVMAELPGMEVTDVDISVSEDILTLRGEKKVEKEEKEGGYYKRECSYGSFHRDIPLPAEIEQDKIEAEFKKGVLNIRLPKKPEAKRKSKKIEIKVS